MAFLPSLLLKDITSPYQSVCLSDKFCLYICPSTSFFNSPHDFIFFPVTFVNKLEDPLNFCDSSCLAVAQRNVVEELWEARKKEKEEKDDDEKDEQEYEEEEDKDEDGGESGQARSRMWTVFCVNRGREFEWIF